MLAKTNNMVFIVRESKQRLKFIIKDKITISLKGYVFTDEEGHCMCIVYGESRKLSLQRYLLN